MTWKTVEVGPSIVDVKAGRVDVSVRSSVSVESNVRVEAGSVSVERTVSVEAGNVWVAVVAKI